MRYATARCTRLELIGQQVRAHFQSSLSLTFGQFLLARLLPTYDPYLPQVWLPSVITADSFAVDLPLDTPLVPDKEIEIFGPCGRALPPVRDYERLLLIADDSPAALLPLAAQAFARAGAATVLLTQPYPLTTLDPRFEIRHGDLISLAKEFAPHADRVLIHTTHTSLFTTHFSVFPTSTYLLLTPPLPCGVGACDACYLKTNQGYRKLCLEGPFINLQSLL